MALSKSQITANYLNLPTVKAFLDLIAWSEGGDYNKIFSGIRVSNLSRHPNRCIPFTWNGRNTCSTASGRYQFLSATWNGIARTLGLTDFSPRNQDIGAVYMLWQRGALDKVASGDVRGALEELASPCSWAGLALSRCGQGKKGLDASIRYYNGALAVYKGGTPTVTSNPNAPIINTPAVIGDNKIGIATVGLGALLFIVLTR